MPPIKLKLNLAAANAAAAAASPAAGSSKHRAGSEVRTSGANSHGYGSRLGSVSRDEDDYASGPAASPATIRLTLPAVAASTKPLSNTSSAASSSVPTPSGSPFSTPGPSGDANPPKRKRGRPPKARPSAIPAHVVATPRSARSPPTGWTTPGSDVDVKLEHQDYDMDPLSLPLSPSAAATPWGSAVTTPGYREGSADTPRQAKWKRIKRPFKDLASKVLQEMRRKDEYGFFLEPVDTSEYPDYLERIGGADKMMDLGTMQSKVDEGEYRNIDELEVDFRMLVTAALAFNLPGTAPVREANKLFNHGIKHINRARPLVLTPSPSPSPNKYNSALPDSERGTPNPGGKQKELPPSKTIPVDMLAFPPNSLQAAAVAWNLTGGRRVRAKRFVRGREKFIGKWRDWAPDGSRDLAEMDDPADILEGWATKPGTRWRDVVDWPSIHEEAGAWWEWEGIGGATGQPPLPNSERVKRPPLRTRELTWDDFGRYADTEPEFQKQLAAAKEEQQQQPDSSTGVDPMEPIMDELRPDAQRPLVIPPGWPAQTFANVYDGPSAGEYVRNMAFGDARGEAYNASVQQFLSGAMEGAAKRRQEGASPRDDESQQKATQAVGEYVTRKWHNGVLSSRVGDIARQTVNLLSSVAAGPAVSENVNAEHRLDVTGQPLPRLSGPELFAKAQNDYAYLSMRALSSPLNPLNLQPLLREPSDFMYQGVGGKQGVVEALAWVGGEIERLASVQKEAREQATRSNAPKVEIKPEVKAEAEVNGGTHIDGDDTKVDASVDTVQPERGTKRRFSNPDEPEAKRHKTDTPDMSSPDEAALSTAGAALEAGVTAPSSNGAAAPQPASAEATPTVNGDVKMENEPPLAPTVVLGDPMSVEDKPVTVAPAPSVSATSDVGPAPGDHAPPVTTTPIAASATPIVGPTPTAIPAQPPVPVPAAGTAADAKPAVDDEDGLRQLRLELVALSKFYPLASLKKMDKDDAARLLPANVRALMTRPGP